MKKFMRKMAIFLCAILIMNTLPTNLTLHVKAVGEGETECAVSFSVNVNGNKADNYNLSLTQMESADLPIPGGGGSALNLNAENEYSTTQAVTMSERTTHLRYQVQTGGQTCTGAKIGDHTLTDDEVSKLTGNAGYVVEYNKETALGIVVDIESNNNPGGNNEEPPQQAQGDVDINVNNTNGVVSYKIGNGEWQAIQGTHFTLSASDELSGVANETLIYLKAVPNEGQRLDTNVGQNRNRYNNEDHDIDTTALQNGTYSFSYDNGMTYQIQVKFEGDSNSGEGNGQGPESSGDKNVTLTLQKYDVVMTNMKDENGEDVIGQNGHPIQEPLLDDQGKEVFAFQPDDRLDFYINNYGDNFSNASIDGERNCAVFVAENAGFSNKENVIRLSAGYGEAWDKITINGNEATIGIDPENGDQYVEFNIAAEDIEREINIQIWHAVSNEISLIWTTNYKIADEWEDHEEGGIFTEDLYVANGYVELLSLIRGGEEIYKQGDESENVKITEDFGQVNLLKGDDIVVRLVPNYGYQLKSASVNGFELQPEEEVSTFLLTDIQNNLHFSGIFVESEDITSNESKAIKKAGISSENQQIADSGNISLTVKDNKEYNKDVTVIFEEKAEKVLSLELTLDNVVSKGNGEYWSTNLTELNGNVKVALELDTSLLDPKESYAIVRDHDGKLEELDVEGIDQGYVVFSTDKFSTYTLVKKETEVTTVSKVTTATLDENDITSDMKNAGIDSVDKVVTKFNEKLGSDCKGFDEKNSKVFDAELKVSTDGGKTWVLATLDNFPKEGIETVLPYPEGTNMNNFDFVVIHMFSKNQTIGGKEVKAGDVEYPKVTKTQEGIKYTSTGLSPFMISWKEVSKDKDENLNKDPKQDKEDKKEENKQETSNNENSNSSNNSSETSTNTTVAAEQSTATRLSPKTGQEEYSILPLVMIMLVGGITTGIVQKQRKKKQGNCF